jgi:hypothetical protein
MEPFDLMWAMAKEMKGHLPEHFYPMVSIHGIPEMWVISIQGQVALLEFHLQFEPERVRLDGWLMNSQIWIDYHDPNQFNPANLVAVGLQHPPGKIRSYKLSDIDGWAILR